MADPTDAGRHDASAPHQSRPKAWSRRVGAILLAGALGLGMTAAATPAQAASPGFCSDGSQPYVPVSEARAWTAGHAVTGKTVSQGTDPEGFTGSYVGYIADALGKGKDLLLFRLSNPTIDGSNGIKGAGIWAGMSGSPVYDGDGRLIGAVAYSLNAENLPIAGVTPAEYMKTIGTTAVSTTAKLVRTTAANAKVSAAGTRVAGTSLTGAQLSQVKTVNVAGPAGTKQNAFTNRTLARTPGSAGAASLLRSHSFMAAPQQVTSAKPLVAGGNIAVTFTSGDLITGSIGTVTAICGNTVWAFGHPMNLDGKTSLLLTNASIALVVPDGAGLVGSYKQVSEIYAPVGMITEDRNAGIRGTIGAVTGFPLTVNVQNPQGKQVQSYVAKVAYPDVSASAVALLTGQAALEQLDQYGAGTGELNWTISFKRGNGKTGKFSNSQVISDRSAFPDEIGAPPANDVWALTQQNYENVTITGVSVTLKLLSADALSYRVSKVERLSNGTWSNLAGSKLKAGSSYTLRPVFQVIRNDKPAGTQAGTKFSIKLSKSARTKGSMKVAAVNDSDSCVVEDDELVCEEWDPSELAGDFDELIALLDAQPSNAALSGKLTYKLTKGSKTSGYSWKGPGVMLGSSTAGFTIKK